MNDGKAAPEIVIVRRRGGDDSGGHHGGAWKIAYADFVTAMMAFFLVMWLINAANEATRAQVASYFNPIKLTDASTGGKGLSDPKDAKNKKEAGSTAAEVKDAEKAKEEQLLADPVKVLDKIAGHVAPTSKEESKTKAGDPQSSSDPFEPMTWQVAVTNSADSMASETALVTAPPTDKEATARKKTPEAGDSAKPEDPKAGTHQEMAKGAGSKAETGAGAGTAKTAEAAVAEDPKPAGEQVSGERKPGESVTGDQKSAGEQKAEVAAAPALADPSAEAKAATEAAAKAAEKLARSQAIKEQILRTLNLNPVDLPVNLEVVPTDEGLLISLTDKNDFGMFTVGSAEPDPKLLAVVEVIAQVLRDKPGFVVVRGHTDSRPFHNKRYDNWQLSSARAQMAYYMLVRGGLDEKRVRRIEGYADRDPKLKDQPDAAVNRRIDILLGQDP